MILLYYDFIYFIQEIYKEKSIKKKDADDDDDCNRGAGRVLKKKGHTNPHNYIFKHNCEKNLTQNLNLGHRFTN